MSAPATTIASSAPHLHRAAEITCGLSEWGGHQMPIDGRSTNRGRLLFKAEDGVPEAGLWRSTPGSWRLVLPADELCYFVAGRARYVSDGGEVVECAPGVLAHFKEGWRGRVEVSEEIVVTYMLTAGGPSAKTPVLNDPTHAVLADWGRAKTLDGGDATMYGLELSKEPDGRAESGLWECRPASRAVTIARDEFCHFLVGRATYTHESGERILVEPGTIIFFPAGWTGRCDNPEIVRKIYMNR
jgi:uncharacterized cupin superfamily protein